MSSFQRKVRRQQAKASGKSVRGHQSKRRQSRWTEPPRQHLSAPKVVTSQPQAEMVDFDARLTALLEAIPPMGEWPRKQPQALGYLTGHQTEPQPIWALVLAQMAQGADLKRPPHTKNLTLVGSLSNG